MPKPLFATNPVTEMASRKDEPSLTGPIPGESIEIGEQLSEYTFGASDKRITNPNP